MLLGVIADDFTGASDIAATLTRGGMRTELLVGVPAKMASEADAIVVALKSRSLPAAEAVAQSLATLDRLRAGGCGQFVFKYCSTFDSTPAGNIGPVAEALACALGARGVVVCPAVPENGRTLYLGHLFVNGRLLSESGLESHPLNPMTDPDIRRWLRRQTRGEIGLLDHSVVRQGAAAIREALAQPPETLVVVDAADDDDLIEIGRAAIDAPLLSGGSSVALALPGNFRERGLLGPPQQPRGGIAGPGVVLSGSCSPATRRQIAAADRCPHRAIDVDGLMTGADELPALLEFALARLPRTPLIYSSADPEAVAAAQRRYGGERLASALENLFGRLAVALVAGGVRRLVVAGGETSGAVVSALGIDRFSLGREIAPGVPALLAAREPPLAMALKSGNFGGADFFEVALGVLSGGDPVQ